MAEAQMNGPGLAEPEYDVQISLADLQADPHNPLYSVKEFKDLNLSEELLKGLAAMNFHKPSKIQERALPLLINDPPTNLIGQSQSGTGKTAAFVLNVLTRINLQDKSPQALVLAPSRELARQIEGVVRTMGQFMEGLEVYAAVPNPENRPTKVEAQVIVGTPGTVIEQLRRRIINAATLRVLVLDEADNMLDMQGLGDQCKRAKSMLPPTIQVVLFSATFPPHVLEFAQIFAPGANTLTLKHEELTVEGIRQFFFDCDDEEAKYVTLVKFYGMLTVNSSIIFCKRRDIAAEVERRMVADGHEVAHLSGALQGSDRDVVIDRFRNGEAKVLITTNVLARGIDVSSVTMVVNYDIPELPNRSADPETYLHRIGRTGRFGRVGVAVTFISNKQQWEQLNQIQTHFGVEIENLNRNDWDQVEETVKEAIKQAKARNLQSARAGQAERLNQSNIAQKSMSIDTPTATAFNSQTQQPAHTTAPQWNTPNWSSPNIAAANSTSQSWNWPNSSIDPQQIPRSVNPQQQPGIQTNSTSTWGQPPSQQPLRPLAAPNASWGQSATTAPGGTAGRTFGDNWW